MRNKVRKQAAREVAEGYAPKPQDGSLMYIFVGTALALLALFSFGRFYDFDFSVHPMAALAVIAMVCVAALVLRIFRQRRHDRAHRAEYGRTSPD